SQVWHAELEPWVVAEHPLDAIGRTEPVGVARVVLAGWLSAGVNHHRQVRALALLVDGSDPILVGAKALNVTMELGSFQPQSEGLLQDLGGPWLARHHRRQPDDPRIRAAEFSQVLIQCARHSRGVRVVQGDDSRQPSPEKKVHHLLRVQFVANRPGVAGKPSPDGREDAGGAKVHVSVYHRRQLLRKLEALLIVQTGKRHQAGVHPTLSFLGLYRSPLIARQIHSSTRSTRKSAQRAAQLYARLLDALEHPQ